MPLHLHHQHSWDLTPIQAQQLQESLRGFVRQQPVSEDAIHTIAGVDASFSVDTILAAAVLCQYPGLQIVEQTVVEQPLTFPYIPGLLAFREAPAILAALGQLSVLPDLLLVDGQGVAHPRRFGIACHLGVLLELPAVGVAKSMLVGEMEGLGGEAGSTADLVERGEVVGVALRTRRNVRPVYLSVGHCTDIPSCVRVVMQCTRGYRLPEPCRLAHKLASRSFKVGG